MLDPEKKKWTVVYPVYLNSKKTCAEGRKIAKAKSVENPTAHDLAEACKLLGLQCELEADKAYPRDFLQKGRVRVLIKENGQPIKPEIPNKAALIVKLGQIVPKLPKQPGGAGSTKGSRKNKGKGKN